jgi:hypothetical protein
MGKPAKKKVAKPKVPTRPAVTHGGIRIELPLLSGPVGGTNPDPAKYPVFNAPKDVEVVTYYLSQLAEIKFIAVTCSRLQKPADKIVQAADVVQCWDTNLNAAIRAFQLQMGIANQTEAKNGIVLPDDETLKALVDYGDLAEKLDVLRDAPKNATDYTHAGGFDLTKFRAALDVRKSKNIYFKVRVNSSTAGNAWTLVQMMQADPLIIDIRWMAYMLATAFWEASHTVTSTVQVPKLDKGKKPVLDANNQPILVTKNIKVWEVMVPIDEIAPDNTRQYKAAVKVKKITVQDMIEIKKISATISDVTNGAWIVEKDGDQFIVAPGGKQKWKSKSAVRGADFVAAAVAAFTVAGGSELTYHGRGYVQLTWWDNYISTGVAIGRGLDLLFDPEMVKQPAVAYKIMSHCMRTGDGFANKFKLSNYFYGSTRNYVQARHMVNGVDHNTEIAAIAELFEEMLFEAKI